jgi:DNA invertase Pin-like site-specific DNA recombinase
MQSDAATPAPRAYSYIRFSTPAQAKGDSLARQTAKAAEYAANHGLVLDTELNLTDPGVSGYLGKNATKGALSVFLKAVEEGAVPKGSYLLIENADRLSRDEISNSVPLFLSIINAGVVVVTLTNGEVYSKERLRTEPFAMFGITMELIRANQESFRKGQLVAAAKERKRTRFAGADLQTEPYTRQTPAWIRWDDNAKEYQLISERAAVIRQIFERADQGWHVDRIARDLNQRDVPTWGEGKRKAAYWRGSYLRKIFNSKAAIGLFTPAKTTRDEITRARRDVPLDPVRLWPAAVDEETYWRVVQRFQTTAARGRNANRLPSSFVAGIAKCTCGGSVIRISKGPRSGKEYIYLVCSRAHAKAKGCEYLPVRYEDVEKALRGNAAYIKREAPRGKSAAKLSKEIEDLQGYVDHLEGDVFLLAELAARQRTPMAGRTFREKEKELERRSKELRELRVRRDTITAASVRARLEALEGALRADPFDVPKANLALRQAVRKIVVDPRNALLEIHWHHDEEETTDLPFHTRHQSIFQKEEGYSPRSKDGSKRRHQTSGVSS